MEKITVSYIMFIMAISILIHILCNSVTIEAAPFIKSNFNQKQRNSDIAIPVDIEAQYRADKYQKSLLTHGETDPPAPANMEFNDKSGSAFDSNHDALSLDNMTWENPAPDRLSCRYFYNQSDGQQLRWQRLQYEAIFEPEHSALYMENNNACLPDEPIHFYVSDSKISGKKYVSWHQGTRLRRKSHTHPYTVNICYFTHHPELPASYHTNVAYSFAYFLLFYGKDFINNTE